MIRNESLIDEGRNRFKRAPRQTSACARRASTLGASPRASGRPLGPGGAPPSPRGPPVLTSRSRCRNATLAAGRADRGRDRLASSNEPRAPFQTLSSPSAERLADLRALRDDQRAKEAEVAAQEAEHRQRPMRTDGLPHACRARLWPCLCCMLHAGCGPDAAWAVAGWGKGRMRRTLLGQWQVGAEAACGFRRLQVGAEAAQKHRHATV
jgi:hypothetical protein